MKPPFPGYNYVYFIKPVGSDGPIKIGYSHIPFERLNIQMNWSPYKLELITWARGDSFHERQLHKKFADQRSHCEWFWPSKDLLQGIEAVKNGTPLVKAFGIVDHKIEVNAA